MVEAGVHLASETAQRPINGLAIEYPPGYVIAAHEHTRAQFLYATHGVMVIETHRGRWVVPPTRGVWLQANMEHTVRMRGSVSMRTLFVDADATPGLPEEDCVINVSPLLRELILEASTLPLDYVVDSRDGRLMRLLLDEFQTLPVLPFYLPWPDDKRLIKVCTQIAKHPEESVTAERWAAHLAMSKKTFHRKFKTHTGITFGQWRQLARLLLSLESLAEGKPIVQVALEHGYNSQSAFTVMFKRYFGMPPSAFYLGVEN